MKYLDQMRQGENLSWCTPYKIARKEDGAVAWLVRNEGETAGIDFDGNPIIARRCESYGDELAMLGYSEDDLYVTITDCEMGCTDCPFFSECEVMQEEVEE